MADFLSMVKSTVDKKGVDIAQAYTPAPLDFIDLDDTDRAQELLTSNKDMLIWQVVTFEEAPIDPLYTLIFGIGAKTVNDAGRYEMMSILGAVKTVFSRGETVGVKDYSPGGDGATKQGYLYITDTGVDPQVDDNHAGLRFVTVAARAVRLV